MLLPLILDTVFLSVWLSARLALGDTVKRMSRVERGE